MIETGQVNTETLISHLLPLTEVGHGFELVAKTAGLKIMIEVNGESGI